MKNSLSGLDLVAIEKELQVLVGSRVDKVYQPEKERVVISISSKGEGKSRLNIFLPGWIWLSKAGEEMPSAPSGFASQLRKHLSNARIASVQQHGLDRIIEFVLLKETEMKLVIELFGDGNVILVGADGKIVALMRSRKWRQRDLRPKVEYRYPPEAFDPRRDGRNRLIEIMRNSDADIVRTLATRANFGGEYSEEICSLAGVSRSSDASALGDDQIERIWRGIESLIHKLQNDPRPNITLKDGEMDSIHPIELETLKGLEKRYHRTFSEAIADFVEHLPREEQDMGDAERELARLERTLASQEEASNRLIEAIEDTKEIAELIFSNYAKVQEMIDRVKNSVEKEEGVDGIEILDRKLGSFETEIEGRKIVLNWKKDARENAQAYFEESKRLKEKLDGAKIAIEETKKKLELLKEMSEERAELAMKRKKRVRKEWFEHYRWFISSEGALVLAGKDAKSNDQLVKKHLQPGDRYVHADIHGAPSAVVKKTEGMTEATLEEAAIFSLAMSKAWNAGIGSGSAYWVTPDQVSKTPQSGEFLPKGAFVIRGKRNYFDKLPVRLAIGICRKFPEPKLMCGPVRAVEKNCDEFVILEPGGMSKEQAAKIIAERYHVSIEEVQAILPPGGVNIIE